MSGLRRRYPVKLPALLAGVASVLAAAGCGSSGATLDNMQLERAITSTIRSEHGLATHVTCPSGVPRAVGHASTCKVLLQVGAYPVTVVQTDGKGHVRYENAEPLTLLDAAKVERAIAASILAQRNTHATVSCPHQVLQKTGIQFQCIAAVSSTGARHPFVVGEVNGYGHVRYEAR